MYNYECNYNNGCNYCGSSFCAMDTVVRAVMACAFLFALLVNAVEVAVISVIILVCIIISVIIIKDNRITFRADNLIGA